jgi:hypothetical protein
VACNNNDDDERCLVVPAKNGSMSPEAAGGAMGHGDVKEEPCAPEYRNGWFSHRW